MSIRLGTKPWKIWRQHWHNQNSWKGLRLPLVLILSIVIGAGLGYLITNHFANWRDFEAFDPATRLDDWIPVIPWMILPYYTLYLYYPMAAITGMKDDLTKREVVIFHQILLITTWFVFAIFLISPAEVDIRKSIFETDLGIWEIWFTKMYEVDTPWNAWPSLHIVQSLLAVLVVTRWYYPTKYKPLIIALWFAWTLLTISVMTTKQHFVWDAVSALIVSFFVWKYWMKPALDNCQTEEMKQAFDNL